MLALRRVEKILAESGRRRKLIIRAKLLRWCPIMRANFEANIERCNLEHIFICISSASLIRFEFICACDPRKSNLVLNSTERLPGDLSSSRRSTLWLGISLMYSFADRRSVILESGIRASGMHNNCARKMFANLKMYRLTPLVYSPKCFCPVHRSLQRNRRIPAHMLIAKNNAKMIAIWVGCGANRMAVSNRPLLFTLIVAFWHREF